MLCPALWYPPSDGRLVAMYLKTQVNNLSTCITPLLRRCWPAVLVSYTCYSVASFSVSDRLIPLKRAHGGLPTLLSHKIDITFLAPELPFNIHLHSCYWPPATNAEFYVAERQLHPPSPLSFVSRSKPTTRHWFPCTTIKLDFCKLLAPNQLQCYLHTEEVAVQETGHKAPEMP